MTPTLAEPSSPSNSAAQGDAQPLLWPYLAGVEGVRKGAQWIRRDGGAPYMPAVALEQRLQFLELHRGRWWSDDDRETYRALQRQTWGVVEVGDRRLTVPQWMRRNIERADTGEVIECTRIAAARMMLAVVWLAFEAGAFGVLMTKWQWAEVLCVSPKTVQNYFRKLEALGLIRTRQMFAEHRGHDGERLKGSQHGPVLVRIGPELDAIALSVFERPHVKARRGEVSRRAARALGVSLRQGMRAAGREAYRCRKATAAQAAALELDAQGDAGDVVELDAPPLAAELDARADVVELDAPPAPPGDATASSPLAARQPMACSGDPAPKRGPRGAQAVAGRKNLPSSPLQAMGCLAASGLDAVASPGGKPPGPPRAKDDVARTSGAAPVPLDARPGTAPPPSRPTSRAAPGRWLGTECTRRAEPSDAETFAAMVCGLADVLAELGRDDGAAAIREALERDALEHKRGRR